jgi:chromosome segregation ATPase
MDSSFSASFRRSSLDIVPGQLEQLQRKTIVAAQENRLLQDELLQGRRLLGEYHAQIALDQIRQENEINRLQQTLDALGAAEAQLEERLTFLFNDCQRLARDNEKISANFGKSDDELAELRRTLTIQEKKNADGKTNLGNLRVQCVSEERELARVTEELREAQRGREKLKLQQWEVRDERDQLEGAVELLEQELQLLKKRMHGTRKRRESAAKVPLSEAATSTGLSNPATQRELAPVGRGRGQLQPLERCDRPDCMYFREQLEQLESMLLHRISHAA